MLLAIQSSSDSFDMLSVDQKKMFLNEILSRKSILFNSYDDFAEGKRKKRNAWEEIKVVMEMSGVKKYIDDWRDVVWRNIRSATMKKVDNKRQTGSGGGSDKKMTEIDELVLLIVGKESPVIEGLNVKETMVTPRSPRSEDETARSSHSRNFCQPSKKRTSSEKDELLKEHLKLQNKKLRLEIKLLKKQVSDSDSESM